MASFQSNNHNNYPNNNNSGGGYHHKGNYNSRNNNNDSGFNSGGGGRSSGGGGRNSGGRSSGGRGRSSSGGFNRGGGGGGGFHNNNNNSGFGGGGGRSNSGFHHSGGGRGSSSSGVTDYGLIRPCSNFTQTGQCPRGDQCTFGHVVQLHGVVDVCPKPNTNTPPNSVSPSKYDVSSISVWDQGNGMIKIFTGSYDGYWRLWNTIGGQFTKEFEHFMGLHSKIYRTCISNQYLFVAFEAVSRSIPEVMVGMVHVWNLQNPSLPPYELCLHDPYIPYAAGQAITMMTIEMDPNGQPIVAVGSKDGSIRLWAFTGEKFTLSLSIIGHSGQITGLVLLPMNQLLWSSSIDGCIRIWNTTTGDNQFCIPREASQQPQQPNQQPPQQPQNQATTGHTSAITSLVLYTHLASGGTFILSSSLDRTIKVWNAFSGECVANEYHSSGIVSMCITKDNKQPQPNDILLIGLENGNIQCRNLMPSGSIQSSFQLLFTLTNRYSAGHTDGPVQCIIGGPSATFYSGGADGKMLIFSITGDLGL